MLLKAMMTQCVRKDCSIPLCRHWWRCWSWAPSWWLCRLLSCRWANIISEFDASCYNFSTSVVLRACICCSCFQVRRQPATCSLLQLHSCTLIQMSLKGKWFQFPVVMIVMVFCSVYRLQSEVDEVLGNKENVSAEDLEKLQYTEQVSHQLQHR